MTGVFLPGQVVTLRGLAADLDVSPMPVRQAIKCLIVEGALEMLPNRTVQVPPMTRDRLMDLLAVRRALEGMVTEQATRNITTKQIVMLERMQAEATRVFRIGDVRPCLEENRRFHFTLYEVARSPVLMPMIQTVWLQAGPFMRLAFSSSELRWDGSHHDELLDALKVRDPVAARRAIESDVNRTAETLVMTPCFTPA